MNKTKTGLLLISVLTIALAAAAIPTDPPRTTPPADFKYTGTKSCSTADCHGAAEPKAGPQLTEYTTWSKKDSHAKAFNDLYNKDSKAIATAMQIKNAAQSEKCTSCHTKVVDKANVAEGQTWVLQNGVSCEVCHGPAEKYLKPHTKQTDPKWEHAESIKNGMIDLRDTVAWAESCVACHLAIDHTLLTAGHPRLAFELVDYNDRQPPHWATPKHPSQQPGFARKAWAVGQVVSLRDSIKSLLANKKAGAPAPIVAEGEALVKAYATVLKAVTGVESEVADGAIAALTEKAKKIEAPGADALQKLAAVDPTDFDLSRQLAMAYRALGAADTKALEAHVVAKNRATFDLAKFKADLETVRKGVK